MAFNSIPQVPTHRIQRFWRKVRRGSPNECWPFSHANRYGYAQIRVGFVNTMAHRFAWVLTNGPIPPKMCVCHRCDNPKCCNPGHLFLGTKADNNRDRDSKGRCSHGSKHWKAKLTEADIPEIKRLRASGMTQQAIANKYGVLQGAIWKVLSGRLWWRVKKSACGSPKALS